MYVASGKTVEIPQAIPGRNANVDRVRRELDQLAGLSTLDFDPEAPIAGFVPGPASGILARSLFSPNVLFYKTGTTEHREKLRTTFPYVLGTVNPETLAKELKLLRRELRNVDVKRRNCGTRSLSLG